MLTVSAVLRLAGHPIGRCVNTRGNRWRTTCPVHHGDNQESFSYTSEVWHCFTCGESGGILGLAERLGVREKPTPRPDIEGMPDTRLFYEKDRTRVVEPMVDRLAREALEHRARIYAQADTIHRACEEAQRSEILRYLDQAAITYQNDPDGRDAAFATAAAWWAEVVRWRDLAHRLYAVAAFDPVLGARDPAAALVAAEEARSCSCQGVLWPERGTRARPRLA